MDEPAPAGTPDGAAPAGRPDGAAPADGPVGAALADRPDGAAPSPLSGRRRQAARNDELILEAAREVFLADPAAPISAVAKRAGVGISALYKRYESKEDLLRTLCGNGLQRFIDETEAALADDREPWTVFSDYMRRLVDADTSSLTLALAGTFVPTEEMFVLGNQANRLLSELFERTRGELRAEIDPHDISLVFEMVAAVRVSDRERTMHLRRRCLQVILDGLRAQEREPLSEPAPTWDEMNERWRA